MAMTDAQLWIYRALFVCAALFCVLLPLLPLGLTADAISMPDLFSALVFAWIIRNPDSAPLFLVFVMALLADILLNRPIGLWAFLVLGVGEYLRGNTRTLREHMFVVEWLIFAITFTAMSLLSLLFLKLALVDTPRLSLVFSHVGVTIVAYPFVVGVLRWLLGVRSPQATTNNRLGRIG